MRLNPTHVIAAACLVLVSWSSSSYSAARAAILDDYYRATPPNSAYLGKMKAKWASHVKARHQTPPQSMDLMPAKPVRPVSRLKPAPVVPRVKPAIQTVKVTRVVPKTVIVPRVTPKATVRRFIAPNRAVAKPM